MNKILHFTLALLLCVGLLAISQVKSEAMGSSGNKADSAKAGGEVKSGEASTDSEAADELEGEEIGGEGEEEDAGGSDAPSTQTQPAPAGQ